MLRPHVSIAYGQHVVATNVYPLPVERTSVMEPWADFATRF
jgi:hypothetical protein